jgi:hypothetical protein
MLSKLKVNSNNIYQTVTLSSFVLPQTSLKLAENLPHMKESKGQVGIQTHSNLGQVVRSQQPLSLGHGHFKIVLVI